MWHVTFRDVLFSLSVIPLRSIQVVGDIHVFWGVFPFSLLTSIPAAFVLTTTHLGLFEEFHLNKVFTSFERIL